MKDQKSPEFHIDENMIEAVLRLGDLSFQLARTDRSNYFPDSDRHESDTDHTVMVSLLACALAARLAPHLDIGRIAQFALVHDLVEAYAGDTHTLGISQAELKAKQVRESAALRRLEGEFGEDFPWIIHTIHEYESLDSPGHPLFEQIARVRFTNTRNHRLHM